MTNIIGIPTTRISDQFVHQRLMQQVQFDQMELFRLQTQLSTGLQFQRPGEAPVAAARIMSLQSLLERKEQVRTNLNTNQSYLNSTDSAMSKIAGLVADIRGASLAVIGTTASNAQRETAALQVDQAVKQLLDAGNQRFRGRYLFAGSTTLIRPFEMINENVVKYFGNEKEVKSYADVDLLFETNVDGNQVFGAISEPVRGSVDFNPVLSFNTRVADLRQGQGISPGSIAISDGSDTSIVDLSTAETIGDIATLIRANPPTGRTVDVEITPTGLKLQLDQAAPGDLSVREVGGGTTAVELGILKEIGVGLDPIVGSDLDPIVRKTTPLADILGVRATAVIRTDGPNNDFIIEADTRTDALNDVTVHLNDDLSVSYGNEVVTYDPLAKRIDIAIDEGYSQAQHVVAAINDAHDLGVLPFTARLDPLDQEINPGLGLVIETPPASEAGRTDYGAPVEFDKNSGLQIVNGKNTYVISLSTAETIEDVLNILNGSEAGVLAEINEDATGIDVRSRLSGADFAIGENGGWTATQLGIRTFTTETRLEDMNFGFGVMDYQGTGTRALAKYESVGINNDIVIRARQNGPDWNDFVIDFVDSGGGAGSETIGWDPVAKTITIGVAPGITDANRIVELFTETAGPRDAFEIYLDKDDGDPNLGTGLLYPGSVTTAGGDSGGADFSITRNDGVVLEIDIAGAETIGEILYAINSHVDNSDGALVAQLASYGNGIELVDDSMGLEELTVTRATLSLAAIDLGLILEGETTRSPTNAGTIASVTVTSAGGDNDLIFQGIGAGTFPNGIEVVFSDTGSESFNYDQLAGLLTFEIDTVGGTDANRIIELLNEDLLAPQFFSVQLDPTDGNDGTGPVEATNPLDPRILSGGTPKVLTGSDNHPLETEGLFTALLRLQRALEENDVLEAQRAIDVLDRSVLNMNFTRAGLGAKQQGLDILGLRLDDEEIELREVLSLEHDINIVEVISNLTARQLAFEAGMKATAQMYRMTLLDYL